MQDRRLLLQKLMIVGFIVLFFALLTGGIYLMTRHTPTGSGPDRISSSAQDQEIVRTGALLDPNREVRGLWIPSVLNITFPSEQGLSAEAGFELLCERMDEWYEE